MAIHLAARIAALAKGGEILARAETLADARTDTMSDQRETQVRGISAPITVASVHWN